MKFSRLFAVLIAAVAWSSAAHAIELQFKFDVNSSGPDLYACNVGLKHQNPGNQVCYIEGTQTACKPETCQDQACIDNCKCTSANGGAYLMDFFTVSSGAWGSTGTLPQVTTKKSGNQDFAALFTDTDAWANRIDNLSFNLGSERYGAEYFVDMCYRGPQIEYYEKNEIVNFGMLSQTSVTDLNVSPGLSYKTLANLATRSDWVCDTQGEGKYKYARNLSNQYNTLDNEAVFGGGDIKNSTEYTPVGGSTITFQNGFIQSGTSKSLRFCKVRYYYNEKAIDALRKWQLHGAQVCTFTKIEEGEFEPPVASMLN